MSARGVHRVPARAWREVRPRQPMWLGRRTARLAARRRMVARTRTALTAAQRAHDPLAHRRRGATARGVLLAALLVGAAGVHVGVVALGFLIGGRVSGRRAPVDQAVRVEVREPPPPPTPPPPPPPADEHRPPPRPRVIVEAPRPKAKAPPPPPPSPIQAPPPRVVGISLDATVEGGGGPAFATGDTHLGQTAERAAGPRPPAPPAPAAAARASGAGHNQVASHLPIGGVPFTPPRRKRPHEPRYPEALKAQEIEADVVVAAAIDAAGTVTSVEIIRPALYPEFNQAALEAARGEVYEPALRDGVPVPDRLSYTYRFRLDTK